MSKKNNSLKTATTITLALSLSLPAASALADAPASASRSGTALVPVRETAVRLGAAVDWNQAEQTVTVTKGGHTLTFRIGQKEALLDGKPIALRESVRVVSGHTLVDAAALAEAFQDAKATSEDPADAFIAKLQAGQGAEAAKLLSPTLAPALPAELLGQVWGSYEKLFGAVKPNPSRSASSNAVHRNVAYTFQATVPFSFTVRLNEAGQVDDFYVAGVTPSTYRKPAYDNAALYTEREVKIGEGAMALPGTLTLPAGGEGPFPAVVLVHGSGPHDRDSTMGGAKPFRDLAVGLAAQGIAVLRYDKVTYEHTAKVSTDAKFTLKRETVDDAISAVKLLKNTAGVDASRIYVAGHSQGAFAMPMIVDADKDGSIAGAILLSGPSGKFADLLALQQKELVSRVKQSGMDAAPYEQQAAQYTAIADMVNDPKYTVDNLPSQFPLQPAYWWFEQKNYVPAELAKKQTGPLLILQGENDWQVPVSQLEGWKQALKNRSGVEYKSYPKVNHLLAEFDGISTGAEYVQPNNVAKVIIDDMAGWIKKTK
ncbi:MULTISPECIES: alpha/beta fold hydrolase [Paenibacillus]|uniref:alpha/beta hydrolase family protein n=1 Tax=Paenibacillus TaxID=44249 RepID=UPI002FE1E363